MTSIMRIIKSTLQRAFSLFIDDGANAAVIIAWTTGVLAFGSHGAAGHSHEGLLLALGLDLIFAVSVIRQVHTTIQSQSKC